MFWVRLLGKIRPNVSFEDEICKNNISKVLEMFSIGSIIIGHTPQSFMYSDDINGTCSGKVWRVDNGSSDAFSMFDVNIMRNGEYSKSRRVQYLEIIDDDIYYVCDEKKCKKQINKI